MASDNKVVVLTGSTGAIGRAIAVGIAKAGHTLVLPSRDAARGEAVVADIIRETGNPSVSTIPLDLASKGSVNGFGEALTKLHPVVNVLVNCAGVSTKLRKETDDGHEMQWFVNVVAYVGLMVGLRPALKAAGSARIVNVASNYAGDLDLADVEFKRRPYDGNSAYRASKQADRLLSWQAAKLFAEDGITVTSCHPGVVTSTLLSGLGKLEGFESAESGAATPLYLALDPAVEGATGKFYDKCAEARCRWARDVEDQVKVWDMSLEMLQ